MVLEFPDIESHSRLPLKPKSKWDHVAAVGCVMFTPLGVGGKLSCCLIYIGTIYPSIDAEERLDTQVHEPVGTLVQASVIYNDSYFKISIPISQFFFNEICIA